MRTDLSHKVNPIAAERSPAAVQRAVLKRKRSPLEPCVGVSSRLAALRRALLNLPIYRRNEWGMLQIRRGGASCAADPPRKGERISDPLQWSKLCFSPTEQRRAELSFCSEEASLTAVLPR